jgi:hypothetical protein
MEIGVKAQNSNMAVIGIRVDGFVYFFESGMPGKYDYDKLKHQGYPGKATSI